MAIHKIKLSPTPPAGTNRLAKVFGRKLRQIREKLGLSQIEAARQAAIPDRVFAQLEDGRYIPNAPTAERLRDWGIRRIDFTGQGFPRSADSELLPNENYYLVKTRLERDLVVKLRAKAQFLGLSQAALMHLAIDWFLQESPALATLAKARKMVEAARIKMALLNNPALRDVLDFEVDELVQKGMLRKAPQEPAVLEVAKHVPEEDQKAPFQPWQEEDF